MAKVEDSDKIMLDSSSFKALASETRVLILKELDKKRCTASEISKSLGISVQAASEHLENLRVAGLVDRVDEGRKWIYFDLTEKGRTVLHPEGKKRLWVMLSIFALTIAAAGFMLFNQPSPAFTSEATAMPFLEQDNLRISGNDALLTQGSASGDFEMSKQASMPLNATNSTG